MQGKSNKFINFLVGYYDFLVIHLREFRLQGVNRFEILYGLPIFIFYPALLINWGAEYPASSSGIAEWCV
jgi:hypothetical protein